MINKSKKSGFTLIEMMVSVAIFTVVAVVVSVGFVNLSLLNKKAQVNRALIDNVNLAMDVMTFKIKEGTSYSFTSNDQLTVTTLEGDEVTFKVIDGQITMNTVPITSQEVDITTLEFRSLKAIKLNTTREKISIRVRGTIEYRQTQSEFVLQTDVSQRNRVN